MEDRSNSWCTWYITAILTTKHDLGPLHKLVKLDLLEIHDEFFLDDIVTSVVIPALVKIVEGPSELFDRNRNVSSFLDKAHFEVSFSRLWLSLDGLQVDVTEGIIRTIAVLNTPITAGPDVSNIGVITFIHSDNQIKFDVICHSDV